MAVQSMSPAGEAALRESNSHTENEERTNGRDSTTNSQESTERTRSGSEEEEDEPDGAGDEAEEEAEDDDADATASDSNSNYSSASEDALPPIHEYGHVYHGSGRMVTPNDACENSRQGYQHELFTLCLGGLTFTKLPLDHLTPESPRFHILDVGCGGGHWAMEMAQSNPLVDVLGIELSSANLPKEVPPNLTFEIADAADDWPPRLYDFIHLRNLVGGGIRDWKRLIVQAFEHLKPGGQLEFAEVTPLFYGVDPDPLAESSDTDQEPDPDADAGDGAPAQKPRAAVGAATIEYGAVFAEIAASLGIDFDPTPKVRPWLFELGAENVRERSDWIPVRNWARDPLTKKKGEILHKMLDTGCNHWTLRMFGLAGWEEAKTRELLARVMQEYEDPLLRSCIKAYVAAIMISTSPRHKPMSLGQLVD
ncbi:Secondary metabolism regulator LAE1 [Trichoderma ghanense]|uniref:Secondary metabolism regulator LAE1 n=1 Tax=Trichoderma ghanense TaxID=65468 RepID=A0ABY2GY48_9HYPO